MPILSFLLFPPFPPYPQQEIRHFNLMDGIAGFFLLLLQPRWAGSGRSGQVLRWFFCPFCPKLCCRNLEKENTPYMLAYTFVARRPSLFLRISGLGERERETAEEGSKAKIHESGFFVAF